MLPDSTTATGPAGTSRTFDYYAALHDSIVDSFNASPYARGDNDLTGDERAKRVEHHYDFTPLYDDIADDNGDYDHFDHYI